MRTSYQRKLSLIISGWLLSSLLLAEIVAPLEGSLAPDFELTDQHGTVLKLSDYRGKQAVYVVFWNSWCHFCMRKIPKLKKAESNLSKQLKIIAINTSREDSIENLREFQQRFSINYALVFDDQSKVSDLYQVGGVPTEFIIDINGVIQHRDGVPQPLRDSLESWNTFSPDNAVSSSFTMQCEGDTEQC